MSELLTKLNTIHGLVTDDMVDLRDRVERIEAGRDRPSMGGKATSAEHKVFNAMLKTGRLPEMSTKEMSMGTAADGGAAVPELIASEIISKALGRGGIQSIVRQSTSPTSDYVRVVNLRGQAASWISETGSRSATASLQMREIRPTHGELYSVVTVSNWLLNDAQFDLASLIEQNAVEQFARSLETVIVSGSGTNRPTGLLNTAPVTTADDASPQRAADALQYVTNSDLGDGLLDAYFALKPEYRRNAKWVMSSATLAVVRKLRDAGGASADTGAYLFQPSMSSGADFDGSILGKPVVNAEDLGTIGGSPQVNGILVGDFQQGYELVAIGPMTVLRDPYSVHGKTSFYVAQRFGGRITDNDAIKVYRG